MGRRVKKLNCLCGMALLTPIACVLPPVLAAQDDLGGRGVLELGVRGLAGDRASAKFNEYRRIEPGLFVPQFEARLDGLFGAKYFVEVQNRKFLESDQAFRLAGGHYSKFRFETQWTELPHVYSNSAVSLFTESSPGVFTIDRTERAGLQATPSLVSKLLAGSKPLEMSISRRSGAGSLLLTPTANWSVLMQYSRETEQGYRPFGSTMNGFTNAVEVPEPIDYRIHQAKAEVEYANERGGFQAGYSTSVFANRVSELIWDNPFRTADAAGAGARGRIALYPDNSLQGLAFAGALNLSGSTRLTASVTPEWMRQNQAFLPFTINSAISGAPQLPAPSLDGRKQTLAMSYALTTNLRPTLDATVRFRSYDYNNNTRSLVFPGYVSTDSNVSLLSRRSLPFGYSRETAAFESVWRFLPKQSLKAGYEWERYDRRHRDVARSQENSGFVSLDLNPRKWLLFRITGRRSVREPHLYVANEEIDVLPPSPTAMGQFEEFRKFDQAGRRRNQADALVQIEPGGRLSFSASWGNVQDRFHESDYGLLNYRTANSGVDIAYALRPGVSLYANYMLERYRSDMRSRQRTPASATAPANDSPNNDWQSFIRDTMHTWGAGLSGGGMRGRLTFDTFYCLGLAKGAIATKALGSPAIPGFLVTSAQDYPQTSDRFHTVTAAARWRLSKSVSPKVEYRFERFGRADFQTSDLVPYMAAVDSSTNTSVFLGATAPGYQVHIVTFSLEYRF